MQFCKIPFINKSELDFCCSCCIGKAHKVHSPSSHTTYNQPLELIFHDLWGPAPFVSSTGYNYYVTFADAYTRYTWIFLLKAKSETLIIFKEIQAMVEKQFGFPIKAVQTGWGGGGV